ncbi:response regulator transcription factor [Dyella terrae]|uniref:response regulator transcription factor n=1 Tax=Dyella terrae TaxID=522259 RepID=UPI001EFD996B|nr:response regulator transcription factor [Dyella terrae]ULU23519.1 response regulator transcription factor [Dyella terrae]
MRVIIADDHPAVLLGLAEMLRYRGATFRVEAEAHCGKDLLDKLKCNPCDLLITDFSMPNEADSDDGLALLRKLRSNYPKLPILVLTMIDNAELIHSTMRLGIQGVVNKAAVATELFTAIDTVMEGRPYMSERTRQQLLEFSSGRRGGLLSNREIEVIRLLASGLTVSELARRSNKSVTTISSQKRAAMKKLGLSSEVQLFEYARTQGLV